MVGSADVRDWQTDGALRRPPASPRVVDRGTPSRVDKRVAPDSKGAAYKQCQGEGKLLSQYVITNHEEGKGKPPRLFPKTEYPLGYPEPALQQKTGETERMGVSPFWERNDDSLECFTDVIVKLIVVAESLVPRPHKVTIRVVNYLPSHAATGACNYSKSIVDSRLRPRCHILMNSTQSNAVDEGNSKQQRASQNAGW